MNNNAAFVNCLTVSVCQITNCWLRVSDDDASKASNYVRSSSPEYDEVIVTDNSDDEEEFSDVIPIKDEHSKSPDPDVLNKDDAAVVFDDSECDDFNLPQADWSCIDSLLPDDGVTNTDELLPVIVNVASVDPAFEPGLSAESKVTDQHEVTNFDTMLNVSESTVRAEAYGHDTSISQGLTFDISGVVLLGPDNTLLHEETKVAEESPARCASRLSRKRCRTSEVEGEEKTQCKWLRHSVDDVVTYCSVAEAVLPRHDEDDDAVNAGVGLLRCYYMDSSNESDSASRPSSSATDTTIISSGSVVLPNMFPHDTDASCSQGTYQCTTFCHVFFLPSNSSTPTK